MTSIVAASTTAVVTIARMYPESTRIGGTRYVILLKLGPKTYRSVATFNEWKATLCQRALELEQPIQLTWTPSKYFEADLVDVVFPVPEEAA